jgi:hypothetical protein
MNKLYKTLAITILALFACVSSVQAQGSPDYTGGLKVKLNEDGSKYFRLITWHQMWATSNLSGDQPTLDFFTSSFALFDVCSDQ